MSIVQQFNALLSQPAPFLGGIALGATGAWWLAQHRLEVLKDRIEGLKEQIEALRGRTGQLNKDVTGPTLQEATSTYSALDPAPLGEPSTSVARSTEFLPATFDVVAIMDGLGQFTSVETTREVAPYLGKWLIVGGQTLDVYAYGDKLSVGLSTVIHGNSIRPMGARSVSLEFEAAEAGLALIKRGDLVKARGRIQKLTYTTLGLEECELIAIVRPTQREGEEPLVVWHNERKSGEGE